jgi:hypothetical protein
MFYKRRDQQRMLLHQTEQGVVPPNAIAPSTREICPVKGTARITLSHGGGELNCLARSGHSRLAVNGMDRLLPPGGVVCEDWHRKEAGEAVHGSENTKRRSRFDNDWRTSERKFSIVSALPPTGRLRYAAKSSGWPLVSRRSARARPTVSGRDEHSGRWTAHLDRHGCSHWHRRSLRPRTRFRRLAWPCSPPIQHGRKIDPRASKRGNRYLRTLFIEAASIILMLPHNWEKHLRHLAERRNKPITQKQSRDRPCKQACQDRVERPSQRQGIRHLPSRGPGHLSRSFE